MQSETEILEIRPFLQQIANSQQTQKVKDSLNNVYCQCFKSSCLKTNFFDSLSSFEYLVIQSTKENYQNYKIHNFFTCRSNNKIVEITNLCTPKTERRQGFGRTTLEYFIRWWKRGSKKDLPIILFVDRSTKHWKAAFQMYQRIGFRQPQEGFEKNGLRQMYGPEMFDKHTFLILKRAGQEQLIRQTFQTNLYFKLFISKNAITDIILSKLRYIENKQFYAPLNISTDRNKIFVEENLTLRPFTSFSPNGLYVGFFLTETQQEAFINNVFLPSPNYKIIIINFLLIEIHYIEDVDFDYATMILEIKSAPPQEYKTLRNDDGEAYAVVKIMHLYLFDNETPQINLSAVSITDPQILPYLQQTLSNTRYNIYPQPSNSTKIVSEESLRTKIRKHE